MCISPSIDSNEEILGNTDFKIYEVSIDSVTKYLQNTLADESEKEAAVNTDVGVTAVSIAAKPCVFCGQFPCNWGFVGDEVIKEWEELMD
jgi:hypothetical protein